MQKKKCVRGRSKLTGECKRKPGRSRSRKCSRGVTKMKLCKKKPGRSRSRKCSRGVTKSGLCRKKSGRKPRKSRF